MKNNSSVIKFIIFMVTLMGLAISSRPTMAFDFNITVNGKPLDLNKNSQSNQQDSAEKSGKTRSYSKSPVGPDVLGFRVGMKPADAAAVFKSRGIKLTEQTDWLRGGNNNSSAPVTKEKYLVKLGECSGGYDANTFCVYFTPVPGEQRIMEIQRRAFYPRGKHPTLDAFERSLVEKYGDPTQVDGKGGTGITYWWIFDSNGALHKPKSFNYVKCSDQLEIGNEGRRGLYQSSKKRIKEVSESLPIQCGSIGLKIYIYFHRGVYEGHNSLVEIVSTNLIGWDANIGSAMEARAVAEQLMDNLSKDAIKRGQKAKPDL